MKKTFTLITLSLVALMSFGCSGSAPKPEDGTPDGGFFYYKSGTSSVRYRGDLSYDGDAVSPVQDLAYEFQLAAEFFKSNGIKYFKLGRDMNVPFILTNFDDVVAYCYPDNAGYRAGDFEVKSTSLETGKCKTSMKFTQGSVGAQALFIAVPEEKMNLAQPVWSVDQVLNDPSIRKYIETAYSDNGFTPGKKPFMKEKMFFFKSLLKH